MAAESGGRPERASPGNKPRESEGSGALSWIIWFVLLASLSIGLSLWAGWEAGHLGDREIRLRLGELAATAAVGVDPADVAAIKSQGPDSEVRRKVIGFLTWVKAANPDCRFVYLLAREGERIVFLAENENPEQSDFREVYADASPEMQSVFVEGRPVVEGPLADRWGEWVSGLAPVKDAGGSVAGLLGVDLSADRWYRQVWFPRVSAFAIVLLSSLIVSAATIGFVRNRRTRAALRYRDGLLRAVTEATDLILTANALDDAAVEALGIVGRAAGAHRMQLFEVRGRAPGRVVSCRHEWHGPVRDARAGKGPQNGPVGPEFRGWFEALMAGEGGGAACCELPDAGRAALGADPHRAILAAPVMAEGGLWGFLAVTASRRGHDWTEGERSLLITLAGVLGNAIKRRAVEDGLRTLASQAPAGTDPGAFFGPMVKNLAAALGVRAALVAELTETKPERARVLALSDQGELREPFEYELDGSPCARVIRDGVLHVERSVRDKFPDDPHLRDLDAESYYGASLRDTEGTVIGHVCVFDSGPFRDPSVVQSMVGIFAARAAAEIERARAQRALAEARDRALDASQAKSSFLASMSHEIRTPMNAIVGMTELLLEGGLSAEQREYAHEVQRSADALLVIIDDILDFSKVEAGRMDLDEKPFDLFECIRDVLRMAQAAAGSKHLELASALAGDCPRFVVGDEGRLRQVLLNLVNNAVKFTPAGRVAVEAGPVPGTGGAGGPDSRARVSLCVRDTGIGIPPDRLDWIFEPFAQVDASSTRQAGGTGLGLSICRRLVDLMGGTIRAESRPGEGSAFTVELPFALASQEDFAATGARTEPPRTSPGRQGRSVERVLIIEDNTVNRHLAALQLERLGVRAEAACDGFHGLDAWKQGRHDVIFMDCQMPGMDGYETAARIREEERRLPPGRRTWIVALTAHALKGERERCLASGMDDYLTKPVTMVDLGQALGRVGAAVANARPDAPRSAELLDHALIAELCGGDPNEAPEVVRDIIVEFVREMGETLSGWEDPSRRPQGAEMSRAAHALKGSAGSVGFQELSGIFSRIEGTAASEPAGVDALLASARNTWAASLVEWARVYPRCPIHP